MTFIDDYFSRCIHSLHKSTSIGTTCCVIISEKRHTRFDAHSESIVNVTFECLSEKYACHWILFRKFICFSASDTFTRICGGRKTRELVICINLMNIDKINAARRIWAFIIPSFHFNCLINGLKCNRIFYNYIWYNDVSLLLV